MTINHKILRFNRRSVGIQLNSLMSGDNIKDAMITDITIWFSLSNYFLRGFLYFSTDSF